jgi:hypothetical protein
VQVWCVVGKVREASEVSILMACGERCRLRVRFIVALFHRRHLQSAVKNETRGGFRSVFVKPNEDESVVSRAALSLGIRNFTQRFQSLFRFWA